MFDDNVNISERAKKLRQRAAERCNIAEADCHIGHISLQNMLDEPDKLHQIDSITGKSETNKSVARRSCRLASAMNNYGLKPGDAVVIMGLNHLDICIPYYACHFNGYSICAIDPILVLDDLIKLFPNIKPKMVFCQKSCEEKIRKSFKMSKLLGEVVVFDDKTADIEAFVRNFNGTQVNFRPALFNQSKIMAWLMLTSGTTGVPKVAMIPFDNLLNGVISWWTPYTKKVEKTMILQSLHWLSSLIFFSSTPVRGYTRVQSSEPLQAQTLIALINTYKPNVTAWSPYLLAQFITAAGDYCDLSSFVYIVIGGSAIEKPLLDIVQAKSPAFLYLVYGMTELLVPVFNYSANTPFGSVGKPLDDKYEFKLVDDENDALEKPYKTGELWIRGNAFFKGYLNNPEATAKILTVDGWFKTGDMFYRDDEDNYFFVERKRLIIKHFGFKLSPLIMEEIIKRHPGVAEACVVGLPDPSCLELPVAAILRRNGAEVDPEQVFDLLKANLTQKKLISALFFVDSFPVTPSGKINRAKVKDLAFSSQRILSK